MAECIQNQLDSGRNSKLFENPIEVIPYRMLLNFKPLSDFAVLQAVGHEMDHLFLDGIRSANFVSRIYRYTLSKTEP